MTPAAGPGDPSKFPMMNGSQIAHRAAAPAREYSAAELCLNQGAAPVAHHRKRAGVPYEAFEVPQVAARHRATVGTLLTGAALTVLFGLSLASSLGVLSARWDLWWALAPLVVLLLLGARFLMSYDARSAATRRSEEEAR